MNWIYQYHVYNSFTSIIVSVQVKSHEYALNFGKRVAIDFFQSTKQDFENEELKCDFVCKFVAESAINVNDLNNE